MANKLSFIVEAQMNALKELEKLNQTILQLESRITSAGSKAQASSAGFGQMFGAVALGGMAERTLNSFADSALGAAEAMVTLASQREASQLAFETMLGSASLAKDTLKDLHDFAAKTPFTVTGIEENAKLLLAMGTSASELLPTIKSLGDVAAGLNVPLEQVALAYGQIRAANQLYGSELRQLQMAGVPILQVLAQQMGTNEAAIKKMVEQGKIGFKDVEKAFQSMSGEGGRFNDLMVKMSGTVVGKWSNIKDATEKLAVVYGTIFTPATKRVEDAILKATKSLSAWAYTADGQTSKAALQLTEDLERFGVIVGYGVDQVGVFAGAMMKLSSVAINVGENFAYATGQIQNIVSLLGGGALNVIGGLKEAATNDAVGLGAVWGSVKSAWEEDLNDINNMYATWANDENGPAYVLSQKALDLGAPQIDSSGLVTGFAQIENELASLGAGTPSFSGGGGAGSSAASEATKEMEKYQKAIEDAQETYAEFELSAIDALENVKQKAADALSDLDEKIADIKNEIADLTESFYEATMGNRANLAEEFVQQEDKVNNLSEKLVEMKQNLAGLMNSDEAGTDANTSAQEKLREEIALVQEKYDIESAALEAFSGRAVDLAAEIEEARRRASLTDFERTVEDLDSEQLQREEDYQEKLQLLADELVALENQKKEIVRLEQSTTNSINNLRTTAKNLYENLMSEMASSTIGYVDDMIAAFDKLDERVGLQNSREISASVAEEIVTRSETVLTNTSSSGSSTSSVSAPVVTINGGITINGVTSSDSKALADDIIAEITRQIQLNSLASQ